MYIYIIYNYIYILYYIIIYLIYIYNIYVYDFFFEIRHQPKTYLFPFLLSVGASSRTAPGSPRDPKALAGFEEINQFEASNSLDMVDINNNG